MYASPLFTQLMQDCKAAHQDIAGWRRHLHENPELSNGEFETAAFIVKTLKSFNCPALTISQPIPNAVIADLKGGAGEGPTVALRADIDALPLNEETDVPFKSTKHGVMHACGHDAHTSMQLGAAKVLCAHVAAIKGTVRFIFQHAEERHPGGAKTLVEMGVVKDVKSIFGIHCAPWYPCGTVGIKNGNVTSCSDSFFVYVRGRGGHASNPHLLVDPIPIAAEVVTALQTIVSRKIDPKLAPVVSIATMTTGPNESHNVIPDEVKLMGTIRSQDYGVREKVPQEIERVCRGIGIAHDAQCEFVLKKGYGMVQNDDTVTAQVRELAAHVLDEAHIETPKYPSYAGEDFSAYQVAVPGCFIWLGVGLGEPLHSCRFHVDEAALPIGASMHAGFVYANLMAS